MNRIGGITLIYNPDEICKIKKTGIGMIQGEKGGGNVFVDVDGKGAPESFEYKIGCNIKYLPKTVSWTSGTHYRYQLMLRVPEKWWSLIKKIDLQKDNYAPYQLLWTGQSVIAGQHLSCNKEINNFVAQSNTSPGYL